MKKKFTTLAALTLLSVGSIAPVFADETLPTDTGDDFGITKVDETTTPNTEEYTEESTIDYSVVEDKTYYVDTDGNTIKVVDGLAGAIDIDGYEFVSSNTTDTGAMQYVYKKVEEKIGVERSGGNIIIAKYVDSEGKEIKSSTSKFFKHEDDTIGIYKQSQSTPADIDGYTFVETKEDVEGFEDGTVTTYTHIYKKKDDSVVKKATTKFVDLDGKEIKASVDENIDPIEIEGYTHVETIISETEDEIVYTHVYKKDTTQTGPISNNSSSKKSWSTKKVRQSTRTSKMRKFEQPNRVKAAPTRSGAKMLPNTKAK